jgi:hypothetical protein
MDLTGNDTRNDWIPMAAFLPVNSAHNFPTPPKNNQPSLSSSIAWIFHLHILIANTTTIYTMISQRQIISLAYFILATLCFFTSSTQGYSIPTRRQFFTTSAAIATDTVLIPQAQTHQIMSHTRDRLLDVVLDQLVEHIFDSHDDD